MRLAYLVSHYPAITHTFVLREIRSLRQQGFDFEVLSTHGADRLLDQMSPVEREEAARTWPVLSQGVVRILWAQLVTLVTRPAGYLRGLWLALTLAPLNLKSTFSNLIYFAEAVVAGNHLQKLGIRHCHTHFSSTVALLLVRCFPITYSATIHGSAEFDDAVGYFLAQKVASARFLIAISQYGRSQLMRASRTEYWDKIHVCPLGVDLTQFAPRPFRPRPETFEIISVGKLAPAKGYSILIDAIGKLVHEQGRSKIRLRIVGGGPEHASLANSIARNRVEQQVVLTGACPNEQVREFYQQTDLFALASFAEGVPVVLMEAMSMEIACLATWITGIPELIRHGEDGWLVPPSDSAVLADAIAHLMDDVGLRRKLGENGRKRVQEGYNLQTNTQLLGDIFTQSLEP